MKTLNKIINFLWVCGLLVLLFLFFPSINAYVNSLLKDVDAASISISDKIPNLDNFNIGKLVKDSDINDSIGYSGEEYLFDSEFYPYYNLLDENTKKLYKQIYANAFYMNKDFAPIIDVNEQEVSAVIESVMYDHPELFWLDNSYSYKYNAQGKCLQINLEFNSTSENVEYNKIIFESEANKIIEKAKSLGTDLEKEKYVHDTLVNTVEYDESSSNNQSAYSSLVNHASVCAGLSKSFQYIMLQLNIPCFYVTGESSGDHAWNIIKINGYYYNVDLTWDSTGINMYEYFNKSDYEISSSHKRGSLSSKLPLCNKVNDSIKDMGDYH